MSLQDYIHRLQAAIGQQQAAELKELLTINPKNQQGPVRASYAEPNDIDLYALPDKFHAVVRSYLKTMRSIYVVSDIKQSFFDLNQLVVALNRAAEQQSNWICPALINCSDELLSLYQVRSKAMGRRARGEAGKEGGKGEKEKEKEGEKEKDGNKGEDGEALEMVAATINKSFKICLTDKSLDFNSSKKACIHFFLAALIKIYFRLDKLELAKSMEKALLGTGLAVPTIINSPVAYRRYTVTYLYFSALLSLDQSEFALAKAKLLTAMQFLSCYKNQAKVASQTEKILMLLVPLKYLESHRVLPAAQYARFPALKLVYQENLLHAVRHGNLRLFDECLARFQRVFLSRHIYLLVVQLKSLCHLRLVQKAAAAYAAMGTATPHIMPYSAIQKAVELSLSGPDRRGPDEYLVTPEEIECMVANLIAKRWIKGYMSHANRCIVLSKTEPFPGPTEPTEA